MDDNKKLLLKDFLKRGLMITIGCILYPVGVVIFLQAGGLATGGATGIALIVNKLTGFSTGVTAFLINIPLMLWGLKVFGRRFFLSNAASLIDSFANSSLFIFIPFLLAFRGIEASFIGLFTSIFFVGNLLGKVIMGRLTDRIGKEMLFICCEVCIFLSLGVLALVPSVAMISFLALILGFFTKGTVPITSTMIAEAVDKEAFESAYSINSLSTSIANTVAPLFFGILADILGVLMIFPACGAAALLAAVPAAIMLREKKMMK